MTDYKEKSYRTEQVNLRLTKWELATLNALALKAGIDRSDYLRVESIYKPISEKEVKK